MPEIIEEAKILIVDDQVANIEILEGFLAIQGYKNVVSLKDPREVIPTYSSFKPDIILLDITMPYLNGFQVMEKLKSLLPPDDYLPILVLTADVSWDAKQKALSNGASDFLTKPFNLMEVGLRIKNLLFTRKLYGELQDQNSILEKKVKERTFELEKTNNELLISKDKAEENDRLKTAFLQNLSHEIRTPMNGILGFTELLKDSSESIESKLLYLDLIERSGRRMMNTISDLVDISRIETGQIAITIEKFGINEMLTELLNTHLRLVDEKGLKLQIDLKDENEIYIKSDRNKVFQIFSHLINNSTKFSEEGTIEFGYKKINNYIEFYVKDNGIGIPADKIGIIFNRFVQSDTSYRGDTRVQGLGFPYQKLLLKNLVVK